MKLSIFTTATNPSSRGDLEQPAMKCYTELADKISKSSIGKPATRKGETHWNWKGGKTKELTKLRNSSQYKRWRKSVFERDEYTCIFCGQKGGWLEADHIKQFAYYEDLRFDVNNGRTLCVDCHKKTDTYGWKGRVYA